MPEKWNQTNPIIIGQIPIKGRRRGKVAYKMVRREPINYPIHIHLSSGG